MGESGKVVRRNAEVEIVAMQIIGQEPARLEIIGAQRAEGSTILLHLSNSG